jgi:hypothetical protein
MAIERYFKVISRQFRLTDCYNFAPNNRAPAIRMIDGERVVSGMYTSAANTLIN